jgi:hypothetical protein
MSDLVSDPYPDRPAQGCQSSGKMMPIRPGSGSTTQPSKCQYDDLLYMCRCLVAMLLVVFFTLRPALGSPAFLEAVDLRASMTRAYANKYKNIFYAPEVHIMYRTVSSSFLISFVMEGSGPSRVIKFLNAPERPEQGD